MPRLNEILLRKLEVHSESHESQLSRVLGPWQLTFLGVGAIIGTGIFVQTGTAAVGTDGRLGAGPAIVVSYIITALACVLAALCYAEFAAMVPVSGSAYTYAYASFGEIFAWIIGWDLILEYAIGNVGVAIGWSGYFDGVLRELGINLPAWLTVDPLTVQNVLASPDSYSKDMVAMVQSAVQTAPNLGFDIFFNLPAFFVVAFVTCLLMLGIRESARANFVLVLLKFFMIALFVFIGIKHVDFATHWQSFAPNGFQGILSGAAIVFFAYIGFDAISTTSEECKNPQRDVPFGMLASLAICAVLYVLVATVLTGMVPLNDLNNEEPVAAALRSVNENWAATVISFGAILAMFSVLLVLQFGQTRIFYAMSRDGLFPKVFSQVSPRFKTPVWATVISGFMVGIPAGLIDISWAADLTSLGTLFAFGMVAIGVLVLRYRMPQARRSFRVPFAEVICPLCAGACLVLMLSLPSDAWIRFFIWMAIGLVLYFSIIVRKRWKEISNDAA